MKTRTRIALIFVVVFGIAAIVLSSSAFIVEEGRQVIVTQFGKPVADVQTAGLYFKLPFIQEVHYLERRLLPWDGAPESMQTRDKKRIDVDVWARWKIIDPMLFFRALRTERQGQMTLDGLVNSAVRDVVARHKLIDVVRISNEKLIYESEELERSAGDQVDGNGRDDVEKEILAGVDLKEYGMKLIEVHIKRVNYDASVRKNIYSRMISERLRIAKRFESEAVEEQNRIIGTTREELDGIEGEMEKQSAEIRGQADAEVIRLTAEAYGKSPEFFEFLRRLEVLKKTFGSETRLILSTESELFRLLKDPSASSANPAASGVTRP